MGVLLVVPRCVFAAAPTSGQVLYLNFNNSSSLLSDSSGSSNSISSTGNPGSVSGKIGSGLSTNGANQHITVSNASNINFGSGSFTFAAWVYSSFASEIQGIATKGNGSFNQGAEGFEIRTQGTLLEFTRSSGQSGVIPKRLQYWGLTPNAWSHVVATFDSSSGVANLYLNGSLVATQTFSGTYTDFYDLKIGAGRDGLFNGVLDEVRVYNRALSASEVQDVYGDTGASSQSNNTSNSNSGSQQNSNTQQTQNQTQTQTQTQTQSSTQTQNSTQTQTQTNTTSCSGDFQQVLNNLVDNAVLEVPCKVSVGSAGLLIKNKSNITIYGKSGGGFVSTAQSNLSVPGFDKVMLVLEKCTNCTIKNLTFEGNNVGNSLIGLNASVRTTVTQNTFTNVGYPGNAAIVSIGGEYNTYSNNSVVKTGTGTWNGRPDGTRGFWLGNAETFQYEKYPTVSGNYLSAIGATGIVTQGIGAKIINNRTDDTNGAGIKAVDYGNGGEATYIENNSASRNIYHGIQLDDRVSSTGRYIIRNNYLDQNAISGIYAAINLVNSEISGNIIINNHRNGLGGWQAGLMIFSANGLTISQNQILDQGTASTKQDNGIIISPQNSLPSKNITVNSNLIKNHSMTGLVLIGRGDIDNVYVANNSFVDSSVAGVSIYEFSPSRVSNVTLDGNCFSGNTSNLLDPYRGARSLSNPSSSSSCANPASAAGVKANPDTAGAQATSGGTSGGSNSSNSSNSNQSSSSQTGGTQGSSNGSSNSGSSQSNASQSSASQGSNNSSPSQSSGSTNGSSQTGGSTASQGASQNSNTNSNASSAVARGSGGGGGGSSSKSSSSNTSNTVSGTKAPLGASIGVKVTSYMKSDSKGDDVKKLQKILAQDKSVYPEGLITGYFGPMTLSAVKKFQVKYGIAKPGDDGYGHVGPKTRAVLNGF